MKDLSARLREIVRREHKTSGVISGVISIPDITPDAARDLTYIPGPEGVALDDAGACIVIDRRYPAHRSHGRQSIEAYRPLAHAPLELFDARAAAVPEWWRRVVFFDIETTGLSGGAGTIAFLVGCGRFDDDGDFTVRQFFLAGPSGERLMLDAIGRVFDEASLVVTYNGRTFDMPFMEMRWAFHRQSAPTENLPHFDMLPPARRLWSRRDQTGPESEGCSLSALERRILGFHRVADVPGFEIPARYFQFLRTGDAAIIEGVLEHNRQDLVSLAAVMSHALWLVAEGPDACREPFEQAALGRVYERANRWNDAQHAYERALASGDAEVQRSALARLAHLHRRAARHDEAAEAWQRILDLVPRGRSRLLPLERQALEALAIHHEHRAHDLDRARTLAETLGATVTGRQKDQTDRRLARLSRKLAKGQTSTSPLLCGDAEGREGED